MKKVINCLHENNPLIKSQLKEVSVEEGMKIATELFEILAQRKDGIGLAANQVGIDAQVAVVNVIEPRILINPQYVDKGNEIPYYEGCLSFKGKGVNTRRYDSVIIKTEQDESNWYFSGAPNPSDGKGSWEKQQQIKNDAEMRLLETICIQHEIDHLNGITIMDRQMITTITNESKVGRNDPCHCGSGKKYKKCCM
tara:strand:- start:663 stop:1250 length:588 start_codon:yes stop_codon:yes gene_type:complete